jgi:hypothetical protein
MASHSCIALEREGSHGGYLALNTNNI